MKRIICIGNQFLRGDDFGPRVYQQLSRRSLPGDVELIDGGIAGLNLLSFFDECEQLIFVDSLGRDIPPDDILDVQDTDLVTGEVSYSHASGIGYLIQAGNLIHKDNQPRILLVGAGLHASEQAVVNASEHCLQLVCNP